MTSRIKAPRVHRTDHYFTQTNFDMMRCRVCGCSNATELDEKRPETCSSCGSSLMSDTEIKLSSFTPLRKVSDEEVPHRRTAYLAGMILRTGNTPETSLPGRKPRSGKKSAKSLRSYKPKN